MREETRRDEVRAACVAAGVLGLFVLVGAWLASGGWVWILPALFWLMLAALGVFVVVFVLDVVRVTVFGLPSLLYAARRGGGPDAG